MASIVNQFLKNARRATNRQPLFSVVIPTRNRAHLLPYALRSALAQDFDDYEIVVVANDCRDNTREVVRSFSNNCIAYYETEQMLTMPENWEFAWTKARGKYVTYLPDDDALVPSALRRLAEHALHGDPEVVSWEDATYCYPDWNDERMQNTMLLFNFGDTLVEDVPVEVYRQQCARFEFAWSSPVPKMLNTAVHRDFFEGWRQKLGKLFFPIAPDYSFAWIATTVCANIRVLHRPLTVRGISFNSAGSNAGLTPAGEAFYQEFGDFDFFAETQIPLPTTINHLAATFLRINAKFREIGIEPESLNQERFIYVAAQQFKEFQAYIPDWSSHVPHLLKAAEKVSPTLRDEVNAILSAPVPEKAEVETLRELRSRTAQMALEYPPNLELKKSEHLGDVQCARCLLGLNEAVLADANWNYLYIFGEVLGASDPYAMCLQVDRYYDLLRKCAKKQEQGAAATAISSATRTESR